MYTLSFPASCLTRAFQLSARSRGCHRDTDELYELREYHHDNACGRYRNKTYTHAEDYACTLARLEPVKHRVDLRLGNGDLRVLMHRRENASRDVRAGFLGRVAQFQLAELPSNQFPSQLRSRADLLPHAGSAEVLPAGVILVTAAAAGQLHRHACMGSSTQS